MDEFKKNRIAKFMLTNAAGIWIIAAYKFMDRKIGGLDSFAEAVCIVICFIWAGYMIYQSFHMYILHIDGKKLEEAYIRSKDERNIRISEKTAVASFTVSLYAVCFGTVISSFFSREICLAMICVIAVMAVCRLCFKFYYDRRY